MKVRGCQLTTDFHDFILPDAAEAVERTCAGAGTTGYEYPDQTCPIELKRDPTIRKMETTIVCWGYMRRMIV